MEKKLSTNYKKSDLDKFEKIITNKKTDLYKEEYNIKEAIESSKQEYKHLINSQTATDIRLYFFQKEKFHYDQYLLAQLLSLIHI